MSVPQFTEILEKLRGRVKYLYFHVMGEPLMHPDLGRFLGLAAEYGFLVCITTNGTLLSTRGSAIIDNADAVQRVSISLHAPEGNGVLGSVDNYLESVVKFGKALSNLDKNTVYRLWNLDTEEKSGKNSNNSTVESFLHSEYPGEWEKRYSGYRIGERAFLEYDGIFTWPSESDAEQVSIGTCHALRSQIAVLADGTVVPCCLDSEGLMPLGNIFDSDLDEILSSEKAMAMLTGFRCGKLVEPVCQKCTYARRFKK
jgi:radical SAM protein with 4Fe4S-binding SPASM domain